jgi:hypothetical protein
MSKERLMNIIGEAIVDRENVDTVLGKATTDAELSPEEKAFLQENGVKTMIKQSAASLGITYVGTRKTR